MRLKTQLKEKRLKLGTVLVTHGIMNNVLLEDFVTAVTRHTSGDWGDVCDEDWQINDRALIDGSRVLSVYTTPGGATEFWIITDADRSQTTGLLPEEY